MFKIIQAITAKYDATPAMKLAGGLYFQHEPQNARMPYGIYRVEADEADENTGAGYVQRVRITVEIYAKKAIDFLTQATAFRDGLYRKPLTLAAGKVIAAELKSEVVDDLETDDDTEPGASYTLVIEYTQTQTRN